MQQQNKKILVFSLFSIIAFQNIIADSENQGIDFKKAWKTFSEKAKEVGHTTKITIGNSLQTVGAMMSEEQIAGPNNTIESRVENVKNLATEQTEKVKDTAQNIKKTTKAAVKKAQDAITRQPCIKSLHANDIIVAAEATVILNFVNKLISQINAPESVKSFFDLFAQAGKDNQTLALIGLSAAYKPQFNKWINYNFNPEHFCAIENVGRILNSVFIKVSGAKLHKLISSTNVGAAAGHYVHALPDAVLTITQKIVHLSSILALWTGEKALADWAMQKYMATTTK